MLLRTTFIAPGGKMGHEELRRGDTVEVKGPAEILATLDERGTLAGLPFMPEMVAWCGKRLTVDRRADKVCDTVNYSGSRRVPETVLLGEARCDGSGHDRCQAECRLFWKEAWLRKVAPDAPLPAPFAAEDAAALLARVSPATRSTVADNGKEWTRYRCQNTAIPDCSDLLSVWDPRTYINEYTNGNVSFGHFLRVTARAATWEPARKLGLVPVIHVPGTATKDQPRPKPLNLQPGEWVRIKSKEEIATMLTPDGRDRGLWFDREMVPYCGGTYRVRQRIGRFIDERSGKLTILKNEAITLDGVVCSGDRSICRWLCPREVYPYWREAWLERVQAQASAAAS